MKQLEWSEEEWQEILRDCAIRTKGTKKWIACCFGPALVAHLVLRNHDVANSLEGVPSIAGFTALELARMWVGLWGWWGFICFVNLAYLKGWVNYWTEQRRPKPGHE